jgi:hypothetical protein
VLCASLAQCCPAAEHSKRFFVVDLCLIMEQDQLPANAGDEGLGVLTAEASLLGNLVHSQKKGNRLNPSPVRDRSRN